MIEDEGTDEHTTDGDESTDTSREGQSAFFAAYAENELGIEGDSDRPSNSSRESEANDDDEDDALDADIDDATRDDDDDSDDDDLEDDEEGEDDEDDADEDDAPAPKKKSAKDADDDDEELDADFLEAAERNKLPTNFEEVVKKLPAEARRSARAAFKGYLREAQAGYTRLSQESTQFRAERKEMLAELAFVRKHPEDFILEQILKDPAIIDRVNQRAPAEGDERAKRIELLDIENRRKELKGTVEKNLDTREAREARGQKIERYAKKLAAHYQIDFELVEDRLILEIQNSENKDISEERVREIIKARAQKIRGKAIERRAAQKKTFVQQKIADRKKGSSATAKARRLAGRVGAPARTKDSDDLRTNIARTVARIAPDMARS